MKTCLGCRHADWERTKTGRLHPSGDGRCRWEYQPPPLAVAFYFIELTALRPHGGFINRRREYAKHCPQYQGACLSAGERVE